MGEKVLLVEDDPVIAAMLTAALRRWGYDVLHAGSAKAAIEIARAYAERIGVALCDIVLPDGPFPAAAIRANCPGVWVIYTSGYSPDILTERGMLPEGALGERCTGFIPKPFLPSDIRDAIGCALLTKLAPVKEGVYAAAAH